METTCIFKYAEIKFGIGAVATFSHGLINTTKFLTGYLGTFLDSPINSEQLLCTLPAN